jgi:phage recombination protein Bet
MTDLAKIETPMTVAGGNQPAIREALRNSFYPGASDASIDMVLIYCQAGGFDPMTKPVHIVPMWDKNTKAMRDTVMPGIGLYRIIADRTGKYAGQDDAEFGPEMESWGIKFPQWCKVTLYKISPVGRVPYSAKVFWLESYATANKDVDTPNSMWRKRPYGQLEKCAEAAALRKAFPEVGMQPTADEMEGKVLEGLAEAAPVQSGPRHSSRTAELKAKINESLIKAGAIPADWSPPPGMDPETGEVLSPVDAGITPDMVTAAIAAAVTVDEVKELIDNVQTASWPEEIKKDVGKLMRARIKTLGGNGG